MFYLSKQGGMRVSTFYLQFFFLLTGTASATPSVAKPNVIFIVADDLGFNDVGFRNNNEINTPNINEFAKEGIVLENYYVQDVCSPSRATFMTGRFPLHNTIVDWIPPHSTYGLPLNETTLAEKFNSAGYLSHAVGKWHLGFYKWQYTPTFRGFNSFAHLLSFLQT